MYDASCRRQHGDFRESRQISRPTATPKKEFKYTMAHRDELNSLYVQLSSEYEKGFSDVKKCSEILEKLKVRRPFNFNSESLNFTHLVSIDWPYAYCLFTVGWCSPCER